MRSRIVALLSGSSALIAVSALAQTPTPSPDPSAAAAQSESGAADLCQELLAYAEKKASEPPKPSAVQTSAPAAAGLPRANGRATGTQGGGSVSPDSSANVSAQAAVPPTAPVSSGAAPEAAASPHASGSSDGGIPLQQVRDTAKGNDRQACRETVQSLRHAGADLPAALIALAAYEPDPEKRR